MTSATVQLPRATALLVIDAQSGFNHGSYKGVASSTPECLPNIAKIIAAFRSALLPIIHIHHHSTNPKSVFHPGTNPDGVQVLPEAAPIPTEPVLIKNVNSGFIGTGLEQLLQDQKITTLVVVGLTTSHCVSTTVRMAGNLGWEVYLLRDATAMYPMPAAPGAPEGVKIFDAKTMHEVALTELHEEFATVVKTEEIILAVEDVGK
ncbi:hypothetical protein DXG03_000628 [Asterophora parasitica]|uniref:Isochorismatase-like domain-containing protein n=1 Tax=Asterophora parasitica TaxID=117018 RepID=A0A9P7KD76_9AGAR|nr:hypothetical protein DXG03_000628 [Asterophora parasitica]